MRHSVVISLFSILFACCTGCYYFILKMGFVDNSVYTVIKALGISAFILLLPVFVDYVRKYFSEAVNKVFLTDTIIPLYALFAVAGFGYISSVFDVNLSFLFIAGGCALLAVCIYRYLRIKLKNRFMLVLISSLFAIWAGSLCWFLYLKPFFLEWLVHGTDRMDALFHAAFAQMIKTYGVPSTGLDGVPYMRYHWGSHWFFVQLSNLTGVHVVDVYQLFYPAVIVPLLFRTFLSFVLQVQSYFRPQSDGNKINLFFWFIFLGIFIGIFRGFHSGNEWMQYASGGINEPVLMLISESYAFSIMLMFGFLSMIFSYWMHRSELNSRQQSTLLYLIFPALIALIGFVKVSTMFVVCGLIGYLYLRLSMFRKRTLNISISIIVLASILTAIVVFDEKDDHGAFSLFYFYKTFHISIPLFLILFYLWTHIFIVAFVVKEKLYKIPLVQLIKSGRLLPIECVLIVSLIGFIPSMIVQIKNYDSLYFSEVQMWISSALLLSLIPFFKNVDLQITRRHLVTKIIQIAICTYLITIFIINIKGFLFSNVGSSINAREVFLPGAWEDFEKIKGRAKHFRFNEIPQVLQAHEQSLGKASNTNRTFLFLQKLKQLDNLPINEKRRTLVYIDFRTLLAKKEFQWKLYCHNIPFIVPALTGMAMIDGIDVTYYGFCGNCCENAGFGYHFYPKWKTEDQIDNAINLEELKARVLKKGFDILLYYNIETESFEKIPVGSAD